MSLVLDWGNSALGDPVDGVSEVLDGEDLGLGGLGDVLVTKKFGVLGMSIVRELVKSDGRLMGSVGFVLGHLGEGHLELLKSEFELSLGAIGFTPLGDVFHISELISGDDL